MSWYNPVPKDNVNVVAGWGSYQLKGNGVPNDASGKLGDTYINLQTGDVFLKRWVGKFAVGGLDRVRTANLPTGAGNKELVVEVTVHLTPGQNSRIILNAGSQYGFRLNFYNDWINVLIGDDAGVYSEGNVGPKITVAAWYNIRAIYSAGNVIIYLNGSYFGILPAAGNNGVSISDKPLYNGSWASETIYGMMLANCKVSDKNTGITYLKFLYEEGSGTTVFDYSGNSRNGTIIDSSPTTFWSQSWVPMDLI